MTNEQIAATAAGAELGLLVFWIVPHAAALGVVLTFASAVASTLALAVVARVVISRFGADDPWREVALDPAWDLSLRELSA